MGGHHHRLPGYPRQTVAADRRPGCYAAYRARAAFAREAGDAPRARHWIDKAAQLKRDFNQAFWLPGQGWFAVALDRDKRPVDALTSNIGHCLWTGIADADKAAAVADRLLSDDMFSGWGIRTLAASMSVYNPMSYHKDRYGRTTTRCARPA